MIIGLWSAIKIFLMIENEHEEVALLEESKKVPNYLTISIHHFSTIFGVIITNYYNLY